ncbi:MAG: MerR family transcriptional regulator [Nitrospirae bacterium]|nr:MerR family transcriptional regulator [Nitrospirota bacterium]MBI5056767.1 MerR family transcriptional regulator [Nitrospirota bacterium]
MGTSPEKKVSSDRLFYKIGEISEITELESYVLRYWETEFPFLKPRKNKTGQRIYTRKDLEIILQIKNLLYKEKYTIAGVRKIFGETPAKKSSVSIQTIQEIRKKLKEIVSILK